jgi:POT family proton-dependent oligopeptide transporter
VRLGERQPSAPAKFVLGLVYLAASFLLMVPAAKLAVAGKVSPLWLVGLFFLQTLGELCLSPVGLSTMTRIAPAGWSALVLGIWFLAASWGSKLAGILGARFSAEEAGTLAWFFLEQAILVAVCAVALATLVPWVQRLMGEERAGAK